MNRLASGVEKAVDLSGALDRQTSELDRVDSPYTKIAGLEIQTYLPNLYFRKFRLIEKLNGMRHGFPTMENAETNANQPIVRPLTPWDKVLEDVAYRVESMREIKKYKIAEKVFYARKCQRKYKRGELKKQEIYCYQRCVASKLAQRVMSKFKEFFVQCETLPPVNEPLIKNTTASNNDVFVTNEYELGYEMQFNNNGENNLLDDLFQDNVQSMQEQIQPKETIETYMTSVVNQFGIGEENRIKRSEFLNQIKESMRKRHKYKEKGNATNVPKTGGAELLLNNLIKMQASVQQSLSVTIPASQVLVRNVSMTSVVPDQKKRKRKEDQFSLTWNEDAFEEMRAMNDQIDKKASKIQNISDMLSLYVVKDSKSQGYNQAFQKTIERVRQFPRSLEDVEKQDPQPATRYADPFYDCEIQQFMASDQYNIQMLIDHFIQVSPFLFSQEIDLRSKNYKMEVDPKFLFTAGSIKDKDSIMFKFDNGMVQITEEKYFSKEATPFGKLIKHPELFFLIEYYLSKFGNKWSLIAECIKTNPLVRGMNLTRDQIQSLHNYYNMKRKKNITFGNKVILPFKDEFDEADTVLSVKQDQAENITQQSYEAYIQRQVNEETDQQSRPSETDRSYLGNKFGSFIARSQNIDLNTGSNTFLDSVRDYMSNYFTNMVESMRITQGTVQLTRQARTDKTERLLPFELKDGSRVPKVSSTAFKRRKIINEKTSPLVGVLSKKKAGNHPQPIKSQSVIKRVQSTTPLANLPLPIKNQFVPPGKQTSTRQAFPTNKQQDKTPKTPVKKPVAQSKGSGQKERRRKPDPKS